MSPGQPIERVVIVGGGTAGWMTAAAAGIFLNDGRRQITLVESDAIGTVGVGEATIPTILNFNALLGIDEAELIQSTGATMKLGIEFVGWNAGEDRYFHPFGSYGRDLRGINFHQLWLKMRGMPGVGKLEEYSMSAQAARLGRFAHPSDVQRALPTELAYAYHFDAALYAALLRRRALASGVSRIEGQILGTERDPGGHITSLRLDDDRQLEADFFIDCSGFRSLLLGQTCDVDFEDWSHWLPCDRAVAIPTDPIIEVPAFTKATAHACGWQWRIPLQHRTGNGLVYSSKLIDAAQAEQFLVDRLAAHPGEARHLRFSAGCRKEQWKGNVVAIGLAAGFLEPLESTSIHLIQAAISKLFALFPDKCFAAIERDQFNRFMNDAYRSVRDFIILHYHCNRRVGESLWDAARTMSLPESLSQKIELFRQKGRVFRYDDELFAIPNWVSVMLGQNVLPVGYDPVVDSVEEHRLLNMLLDMRRAVATAAQTLSSHSSWLERRAPFNPSRPEVSPSGSATDLVPVSSRI